MLCERLPSLQRGGCKAQPGVRQHIQGVTKVVVSRIGSGKSRQSG